MFNRQQYQNRSNWGPFEIRRKAVSYIQDNRERFENFFTEEETLDQYLDRMSQDGVWAEGQVLEAAAMVANIKLNIIDFRDGDNIHPIALNNQGENLPLFTLIRTGEDQKAQHYAALHAVDPASAILYNENQEKYDFDESYEKDFIRSLYGTHNFSFFVNRTENQLKIISKGDKVLKCKLDGNLYSCLKGFLIKYDDVGISVSNETIIQSNDPTLIETLFFRFKKHKPVKDNNDDKNENQFECKIL